MLLLVLRHAVVQSVCSLLSGVVDASPLDGGCVVVVVLVVVVAAVVVVIFIQ